MPTIHYEFYSPAEIFRVVLVTPGFLTMRVTFSKPALLDNELLNPDNYTITVIDPETAFDMQGISVTPEPGVEFPTYVDVEMTDCTHGKDYKLVVVSGKIQSSEAEFLNGSAGMYDFVGVSEMPEAIFVEAISSTTVRVTFSKIMGQGADILDRTHYVFTGGLTVTKVERETPNSVILTTTEQAAAQLYDLTVS